METIKIYKERKGEDVNFGPGLYYTLSKHMANYMDQYTQMKLLFHGDIVSGTSDEIREQAKEMFTALNAVLTTIYDICEAYNIPEDSIHKYVDEIINAKGLSNSEYYTSGDLDQKIWRLVQYLHIKEQNKVDQQGYFVAYKDCIIPVNDYDLEQINGKNFMVLYHGIVSEEEYEKGSTLKAQAHVVELLLNFYRLLYKLNIKIENTYEYTKL